MERNNERCQGCKSERIDHAVACPVLSKVIAAAKCKRMAAMPSLDAYLVGQSFGKGQGSPRPIALRSEFWTAQERGIGTPVKYHADYDGLFQFPWGSGAGFIEYQVRLRRLPRATGAAVSPSSGDSGRDALTEHPNYKAALVTLQTLERGKRNKRSPGAARVTKTPSVKT